MEVESLDSEAADGEMPLEKTFSNDSLEMPFGFILSLVGWTGVVRNEIITTKYHEHPRRASMIQR